MDVRLLASRLASAETREAAARALALLSGAGALLTLLVLAASGRGIDAWLFVLLAWALFVYLPLRILIEAAQTFAPALRRRLGAEAVQDERGGAARPRVELAVDALFESEVVMPRIATPREAGKARDGAAAVLVRAGTDDALLRRAAADCLGAVDRWVTSIGPWAARDAGQNIQARWGALRALAALAAMTKILIASSRDAGANANGPYPDPARFLDACLDYCDDLSLQVDVTPWDIPPAERGLPEERAALLRDTWTAFARTGAPALEARAAFVEVLLSPSSRPAPPTAS